MHTLNTKTIRSNLKSLNTFTKETGSLNVKLVFIKVKLPKVGSNAIVPVPVRAEPNKATFAHSVKETLGLSTLRPIEPLKSSYILRLGYH